jgi:hypothetical protein
MKAATFNEEERLGNPQMDIMIFTSIRASGIDFFMVWNLLDS